MFKIIVGIMVVLTSSVLSVCAQETNVAESPQMSVAQPIEVGNKICPVSGDRVGEMGPPVKFTYNGKVYNLCCPMCIGKFRDDPEKYSKIAEDEVSAQKK